ncbi:MAG TPA: hypothetical protein VIZ69_12320 [Thermoanaerobaculia bacterium]
MKPCPSPLDPLDIKALAAGMAPVSDAEASEHARACPACAAAVAETASLTGILEQSAAAPAPDLSERVLRVRPFSRLERRSASLWAAPSLFALLLFAAGVVLLALPGVTGREQASLGIAAAAPLFAIVRASLRALRELAGQLPAGLSALSDAVRGNGGLAAAALLLLLPTGLGLRRALARARR